MLARLFGALWRQRREVDDLREFLITEMINLVKDHLQHASDEPGPKP